MRIRAFFRERKFRPAQIAGAAILLFVSLFLVGLCTNTIVLPFFDLSDAIADKTQNLSPTLDKPEDLPETGALSFLEVLTHLSVQETDRPISGEVYGKDSAFVLAKLDPSVLPAQKTVDGKPALEARQGFLVRRGEGGVRTLLSAKGEVILSEMPEKTDLTGHWDDKGRAVFTTAEGYRVYDAESGTFLESDYEPALSPITGIDLPVYYDRPDGRIALAYRDGKYGYYYTDTGEANYQFTHSSQSYQFREGRGALGTDAGIIVVDYVAKRYFVNWGRLLQPEATGAGLLGYYRLEHGLFLVRHENADGESEDLILTEGESVFYLPRDFTRLSYSDGVFLLKKDDRFGYLDHNGRWIASPQYTDARPFSEGLGVLTRADGKMGVVDTSGTFVIPCEFDLITGASGGIFTLYSEGRWVVLYKV